MDTSLPLYVWLFYSCVLGGRGSVDGIERLADRHDFWTSADGSDTCLTAWFLVVTGVRLEISGRFYGRLGSGYSQRAADDGRQPA